MLANGIISNPFVIYLLSLDYKRFELIKNSIVIVSNSSLQLKYINANLIFLVLPKFIFNYFKFIIFAA